MNVDRIHILYGLPAGSERLEFAAFAECPNGCLFPEK